MDLGLDFEGWAPHGWIAEGRTIPSGVIVPHRNRTRFWGGLPVNAAFQTVQERLPSQEIIQNTSGNIISRQKRC